MKTFAGNQIGVFPLLHVEVWNTGSASYSNVMARFYDYFDFYLNRWIWFFGQERSQKSSKIFALLEFFIFELIMALSDLYVPSTRIAVMIHDPNWTFYS